MPGYPCCCRATLKCLTCKDQKAPKCVQIDLAGFADDECGICEQFNGTFYLSRGGAFTPENCGYGPLTLFCACDTSTVNLPATLQLYVYDDDPFGDHDYRVLVLIGGNTKGSARCYFEKVYGETLPDCLALDAEDLGDCTWNAGFPSCDVTGATCTVTALTEACPDQDEIAECCSNCLDGRITHELAITIGGVVAMSPEDREIYSECEDCDDWNTTFILAYTATGAADVCGWLIAAPCHLPGFPSIELIAEMVFEGGSFKLRVTWGTGFDQADPVWFGFRFEHDFGANRPDCTAFDAPAMTRTVGLVRAGCDCSAATCSVSSVP
jgi:hypothetical protein